MIVTLFPEPREQAKAIGAVSFVGAAGASIGLVLGGVLTEAVGWHWIFFVNVPIGVLVMIPSVKVLRAAPGTGLRNGADWLGALLVTAGLMLGVYAIVGTSQSGLGLLPTAAVIGTVALGLSARIAARFGPRPMLLAGLGLITAGLALLTLIPVAVLSTLAAAQTRSQHSAGTNTAAALAAGYHLAFATAAGLAGTAIVVAAVVLWPSRRRAVLAECC